ncbi:MAG: DNA polymerase III subunit beta [Rikenellaceae bacterium]
MVFKISSVALLNVLQNTGKVIAPKQTMPILDYFLFSLDKGKLTITATDLESTIISEIEVDSADEDGVAAVPSRLVIDVLRELSDQPVLFSVEHESFDILLKWETGDIMLPGLNGFGFPEVSRESSDDEKILVLASDELLAGINKTFFATANSDTRPTLNGILMDVSADWVVFVATDAHELVKLSIDKQTGFEEPSMVIIPKKSALLLRSILAKDSGDVKIEFGGKNIKFTLDGYTYISRVIEGRYPNYNSVIPKNNPNSITVDRAMLLNSVKRVSVCSNQGTDLVRFIIGRDKIALEAKDLDFSTAAKDSVSCAFEGEGVGSVIGLKSRNIIEMLSVITSSEIRIEFADTAHAVLFMPIDSNDPYEKSLVMMLMPVGA